jgi:septal ring factor EnvC (AmiA/AmiB activator)
VRTTLAGFLIACACTLGAASALGLQESAPPSSASPTATSDERLKRVQERRAALERDLKKLRGQEQSLLGEVERLDLEARVRAEELRETQLLLQRTNQEMDDTLRRLRTVEDSIEKARPVLAERARALYKLGELSYVRLLLSVEQPSDMFRGYRLVTTLARRDKERIAGFRSDLQAAQSARRELEAKTQQVVALRAD